MRVNNSPQVFSDCFRTIWGNNSSLTNEGARGKKVSSFFLYIYIFRLFPARIYMRYVRVCIYNSRERSLRISLWPSRLCLTSFMSFLLYVERVFLHSPIWIFHYICIIFGQPNDLHCIPHSTEWIQIQILLRDYIYPSRIMLQLLYI